ncbi:DUF3999 family protein [Paenibacillus tepidiphilus]|uniref:DUF3999 family protein n=1 Tax=Paenibacillus tepidiphilus TaxID=2608683 RepID=UPI00123AD40F|nr:DUF3999 family protein [Paenibacillus tepidiphilus]
MPRHNRMIARTKALLLLLSLPCLLLSALPVSAASSASDGASAPEWSYSRPVEFTAGAAYVEFYLDEQVYGAAADDLRDLRIADHTGKRVPFYIESGVETLEEHTLSYSSTLIHKAKKNGDTSFDYQVTPLAENTDILGNRLEFALPDGDGDFLLHVELLGSYDGLAWESVASGDLYRVGGREQNGIALGASRKFGYYRLVAKQNAADLQFPEMTLLQSSRVAQAKRFQRRQAAQYEAQQAEKRTEITVHNPHRLRISGLLLESGGSFSRRYGLYDGDGTVIPVTGSGELYRLDFKDAQIASTAITPVEPSNASVLRIVIDNRDDAPVPLTGIELDYLVDRIVFADEGAGPYRLLYGNAEAAAPQYDIVNFKDYIAGEEKTPAALGAPELRQLPEAPAAESSPLQGRLGFNIVMIAVSLLLVYFLARKLGRK